GGRGGIGPVFRGGRPPVPLRPGGGVGRRWGGGGPGGSTRPRKSTIRCACQRAPTRSRVRRNTRNTGLAEPPRPTATPTTGREVVGGWVQRDPERSGFSRARGRESRGGPRGPAGRRRGRGAPDGRRPHRGLRRRPARGRGSRARPGAGRVVATARDGGRRAARARGERRRRHGPGPVGSRGPPR